MVYSKLIIGIIIIIAIFIILNFLINLLPIAKTSIERRNNWNKRIEINTKNNKQKQEPHIRRPIRDKLHIYK